MKHALAAWTLVVCACLGGRAVATPEPADARKRAGTLLDEGRRRFEAGDPRGALERFEAAYATYPSPRILYNLGYALARVGRPAEAAQVLDRFLRECATDVEVSEERRRNARDELRALVARIGRIELLGAPPTARVRVDGARLAEVPPPRIVYVAPGTHQVEVEVDGFSSLAASIDVAAGGRAPLSVKLDPVAAARAAPAPAGAPVAPSPPPPTRRRVWTWVAGGLGVALVGAGVAVSLSAHADYDEYQRTTSPARYDELRDAIPGKATAGSVLLGTGAAALAGAVALWIFEGRSEHVAVVPAGTGVALVGRF